LKLIERCCGCLGIVVIALHRAVPACTDLTLFVVGQRSPVFGGDDLQLDARQRSSDGFHAQFDGIVDTALGNYRRGFGLAVSDGDLATAHVVNDFLHHLDGARAARHDAAAQ